MSGLIKSSAVPVGSIVAQSTLLVPGGFLECDGALLSRTTFARLFAVLGTLYGVGDGSTTYNLPDFRGEFLRGVDHGKGVDAGRLIATNQSGTTVDDTVLDGYQSPIANGELISSGSKSYYAATVGSVAYSTFAVRPRNVAIMHCIKY